MTTYKYRMTINDVESNDVYNFDALFLDHMEADRFLTENESVGNTIIIHSITKTETSIADLDCISR